MRGHEKIRKHNRLSTKAGAYDFLLASFEEREARKPVRVALEQDAEIRHH